MMQPPRARPRFSVQLNRPPSEIRDALDAALRQTPQFVGHVFERTAFLTLAPHETHFWTPHLDLQLVSSGDVTRIDGRFAPHPRVWTAFWAGQLIFGMLALGMAMFWLAQQLSASHLAWPFWGFVAAMVGGGLAFGAAYVGQGIANEQMYLLRSFLDEALRRIDPGYTATRAT